MANVVLRRVLSCFRDKLGELSAGTNYYVGEYFPFAGPGKIARIEGLETVKAMDPVEVILERYHEGDRTGITDSMYQIAYSISVGALSDKEAAVKLKAINDTLHLYDEGGNEMLYKYEDYKVFHNN